MEAEEEEEGWAGWVSIARTGLWGRGGGRAWGE